MLDKLEAIKKRWKDIEQQMNAPTVMSDMKKFIRLNKDYKDLQPIIEGYEELKNVTANIESAKDVIKNEKDEEFRTMAKEELNELLDRKYELEEKIRLMLIPADPEDSKNAIVEIRAGTGGDEASIFAGDLYRMYVKFCETKGWKLEGVDVTEGTVGGFKEIIFNVSGENVYGQLKYESGVHRVQRVPQTETQGRVHTSAASVVVLPEADEFDRSFLKLRPWFAVITSADADHLDIYGDKNSLLESFGEFAANVHPQGVLLVKLDAGLNISSVPVEKVFSYALDNSKADVFAKNIRVNPHFMTFDFIAPETEIKGLEMQSLGLINVENAVAAIFMALNVGVNENEIRAALKSFSGVQRRFQRQYLSDEVVFIDDYAHHPEEIKALVNSVRAIYHGKKITGIFQPHLYSRTRDFADDFAKSLSLLDDIILLEIYPARENPIPDITSEIIFQKIAHSNKSLISKTELPEFLNNKDLQILLTIGAGDIDRLVIPIRQMLEKKHKNQLKS